MDEWEYVQEPGNCSKVAGAPLQCEVVLQDVDHDSDDSAWEILHSATASEASTATFPLALPVHIEDQCSPSSGSWHRQVSPDACLSATPVIIKESSAQIAVPKDTEADNFLGAEDLPLSRVIAAKRSPVKKAESPNPAPYGGSEHMAGSMSDICGRAHAVSHSTGKAISGKQAEDEGGSLQAEKNLHAELERKVAELEQMIAARQIYTSAAMQSGSEGYVQPHANVKQEPAGQPHWSRVLGRESGFVSMGDIGRVDYRSK